MQKLLLSEIENAKRKLEGKIVKTPILPLEGSKIKSSLPFESKTFIKLELYQHTGSFKARGNLLAVDKLTDCLLYTSPSPRDVEESPIASCS